MKKLSILLAATLLLTSIFAMSSCSDKTPAERETVRVTALKGPTGMGAAKLMSDDEAGTTINDYEFTLASAPDEVTAEIIKGDFDIAAVPTNLASVLYNKTEGAIQVVALNTLGVLYVLENGDTIESIADLEGKTIYASGQGATPEYVLNFILEKNGITADIQYVAEHAELATLMASGDAVIGMLPEPNVSTVLTKNSDVRVALNLTEEWNKAAGDDSALVMGCIVASDKFISEHPEAFKAFCDEYAASVEYVNANMADAAVLIEKYGIVPSAAAAEKALPNCNIICIRGDEMKSKLSGFLNVLLAANPASVGGSVPGDDFYN